MIWICIPVHNNIKYTLGCINSLNKQTYQKYKIVVCDDGSTDRTSEIISQRFPEVILLKGDGNLWWAGAVNECIKYALNFGSNDDYILLLNNDLVVDEDYLKNLISKINSKEVLGSIAHDIEENNKIVYAGELLNKFSAKSFMIHRNFGNYKNLIEWEVDLLTGRGTFFPLNLINEIGLLNNDNMPQYGSDVEFFVRAKKAGFALKINKKIKLYSYVRNTGKGSVYKKNSTKDFITSFFSINSPNYYRSRFYFARAYTSDFWLPVFLLLQFLRITGGYIKRSLQWGGNE